jgi:hypothetical protein
MATIHFLLAGLFPSGQSLQFIPCRTQSGMESKPPLTTRYLQGTAMKSAKSLALALTLALGAGAAFAEGPIEGNEVFNFQSTLSRAEVQAQAVQANREGRTARGEIIPADEAVASTGLSREQVRAEALQAQRSGRTARGEIVSVEAGA